MTILLHQLSFSNIIFKSDIMRYAFFVIVILFVVSCQEVNPGKNNAISTNGQMAMKAPKEPRKLRYIMSPVHCGILGFFNDGSVAGCTDPSISKHNIAALDTAEVFAHYSVDKHFIIFDDDHSSLDFSSDVKDAYKWVMVDYQWKMNVPE